MLNEKKIYILDTNVLIHNPAAIFDFKDNIVVLPIGVLEELDKLKKLSTEVGYSARTASRSLDKIICLSDCNKMTTGIEMENGGVFRFDIEGNHFEMLPIAMRKNTDNSILVVAMRIRNKNPESDITIVSKDINLRVKAKVLEIQAEDYKTDKVDTSGLYTGVTDLVLKDDELATLTNKAGKISDFSKSRLEYTPNQCFKIKGTSPTVLARFSAENNSLIWVNTSDFFNQFNGGIKPCNDEQIFAYNMMMDPNINLVSLYGPAGTGKTLVTLLAGIAQLNEEKYEKMCIFRINKEIGASMGYLPGSEEEKLSPWARPIITTLKVLYDKGPSRKKRCTIFEKLMSSGLIEISGINFVRGDTFAGSFVIIDDSQNLTPGQMKALLTRAGKGSKYVLTGDLEQIDDPHLDPQSSGLSKVLSVFPGQKDYAQLMLTKTERSSLADTAAKLL